MESVELATLIDNTANQVGRKLRTLKRAEKTATSNLRDLPQSLADAWQRVRDRVSLKLTREELESDAVRRREETTTELADVATRSIVSAGKGPEAARAAATAGLRDLDDKIDVSTERTERSVDREIERRKKKYKKNMKEDMKEVRRTMKKDEKATAKMKADVDEEVEAVLEGQEIAAAASREQAEQAAKTATESAADVTETTARGKELSEGVVDNMRAQTQAAQSAQHAYGEAVLGATLQVQKRLKGNLEMLAQSADVGLGDVRASANRLEQNLGVVMDSSDAWRNDFDDLLGEFGKDVEDA